jgi:predicted nucleic acid-binding protein
MAIAFDTNVLLYAHRSDMAGHQVCRDLVKTVVTGEEPRVMLWPCVYESAAS